MNRARDWWVQAQADLRHARYALEGGHYEWACFAAHQAAEKGIKALFEHRGARVTGHALTRMLQALQDTGLEVDPNLLAAAKILDKFYVPTRYPNGLPEGAPTEFYTREEAEHALRCAEQVLRFCAGFLGG
ncbi:HEPN domain-containing protein [Thermoflexus sp.]|nr:HEPN domain-containing protein [Thermoflexus sp.]MCS6963236.1 HEPN domain-containing protein [Thermoflexus sp.]MCX7691220.1 HEPN domain-containing protein [Thermoflexus sp.]MDW8064173.1 HEPN domain-containing protein [Anaerolineae bacterium]MDW8183713.1 HEPN domain-containing protein [Anaerolineae bacterium]